MEDANTGGADASTVIKPRPKSEKTKKEKTWKSLGEEERWQGFRFCLVEIRTLDAQLLI